MGTDVMEANVSTKVLILYIAFINVIFCYLLLYQGQCAISALYCNMKSILDIDYWIYLIMT